MGFMTDTFFRNLVLFSELKMRPGVSNNYHEYMLIWELDIGQQRLRGK